MEVMESMSIGRFALVFFRVRVLGLSCRLSQCEADLPEKLRFGKIDVSCEGWAKAGDPYVLKGTHLCRLIWSQFS